MQITTHYSWIAAEGLLPLTLRRSVHAGQRVGPRARETSPGKDFDRSKRFDREFRVPGTCLPLDLGQNGSRRPPPPALGDFGYGTIYKPGTRSPGGNLPSRCRSMAGERKARRRARVRSLAREEQLRMFYVPMSSMMSYTALA